MNDPGPYAPAHAVDPAPPPRPPGKVLVFLWALFATGLGGPALWNPFIDELLRTTTMIERVVTQSLAVVPAMLGFLWALMSDRWPVLGTRREGYLVLGCMASLGGWAVACLAPQGYGAWVTVMLALALGAAIIDAATEGALVELGRRHAASGRLAASAVGLPIVVGLVGTPLGTELAQRSLFWTAGAGAALALSITLGAVFSTTQDRAPAPGDAPPRMRLREHLRSRELWAVWGLGVLARVGDLNSRALLKLPAARGWLDEETWERLAAIGPAASLAAVVAAFVLCRRLALRHLLRASLLARALGLSALLIPEGGPREVGFAAYAFTQTLADIALLHLVLRAAPRGREALGCFLLMSVPTMLAGFARPWLMSPLAGMSVVVMVTACASLLATLAVALVPRALLAAKDGVAPQSQNERGSGM